MFAPEYAYGREDREGKRFGDELERIGYRGASQRAAQVGALFELHIEQGPILEAEGKVIGVVQGVQGMRWYEVTVTGQDAHTGSTPMHLRKNALLGAARMIERIDQIALEHAPGRGHGGAWSRSGPLPQCDPGRGVLHRRLPPPRGGRARYDGAASSAPNCPR